MMLHSDASRFSIRVSTKCTGLGLEDRFGDPASFLFYLLSLLPAAWWPSATSADCGLSCESIHAGRHVPQRNRRHDDSQTDWVSANTTRIHFDHLLATIKVWNWRKHLHQLCLYIRMLRENNSTGVCLCSSSFSSGSKLNSRNVAWTSEHRN